MHEVASRELRNNTRSLLDRVDRGETIVITVDGRPAAALTPIATRPRWISRADFVFKVLPHQADVGLSKELADLAGETTDDLPFR